MKQKKKRFQEPNALNGVAEFHDTFELPVESEPLIPAADRCELRINLLQEELDELKAAIAEKDLVEVADAFSDIQYVLSGAILEFGMGEKFKDLFDEVQRSNMSKRCASREEAEATMKHYAEKDGTEAYIVERDNYFLVYRKSDGKVLKSVNYSPADIPQILNS